jgi:hypothetical protein
MSDDLSPVLSLPLIQPAQAQKHVTHNEALRLLDVLVQPAVQSRSLAAPPAFPAEGARWIVPAGATGPWAGQDGTIALHDQGDWVFLAPLPGWQVQVIDQNAPVHWTGTAWVAQRELPQRFPRLGLATDADDTNRLAVSAAATLLTHAGAGHQVKINKAAAAETASLLFQTGWSGRAEIGTAGDDSLAVKISADGSAWITALGFSATGLASGAAVMTSATDATAGRLLRLDGTLGAFGLGGGYGPLLADLDATTTQAGFYFFNTSSGSTGTGPGFSAGALIVAQAIGSGARAPVQIALERSAGGGRMAWRTSQAGAWGAWRTVFARSDMLGTVSQSAGVPTGAALETATNANGRYTRHADGRQICEHVLTVTGATSADGALFRSAIVPWTYPAAFATGTTPAIFGDVPTAGCFVHCAARSNSATSGLRVYSTVSTGASLSFNVRAEGRWF